jgi:23S rRNA pseudouridine1911/1915/1917 synthase
MVPRLITSAEVLLRRAFSARSMPIKFLGRCPRLNTNTALLALDRHVGTCRFPLIKFAAVETLGYHQIKSFLRELKKPLHLFMKQSATENSKRVKFVVSKDDAKLRLDRILAQQLPEYSRSRLQQLIRGGFVRLNKATTRPSHLLRSGDKIELIEPPLEKIEIQPERIPLDILFEDSDLIVINKPAGLVVHPGAGHGQHTLVNALLSHCTTLSGIGGKERPGIVHRLDKETSGCLVVAKNDATHRDLSRQFAERTVEKTYLALVARKLRKQTGAIEEKIRRHPVHRQRMTVTSLRGRAAKTEYRVLRSGDEASLIECRLHSGRTHQIRVHLHHIGHPVVGDKVYAARQAKDFPRQMLHAWKLGFCHPRSGEWRNLEAPLPDDFATALKLTTES